MINKSLLGYMFVIIIISAFLLTGCGTKAVPVPTVTPAIKPTQTLTPAIKPTLTLTPIPTPIPTTDPMIEVITEANQINQSLDITDIKDAISKYDFVLQNTTDTKIRSAAFSSLMEIGSRYLKLGIQEREKAKSDYDDKACVMYKVAASAFEPILKAKDRPPFEKGSFYSDAADSEGYVNFCLLWNESPRKSFTEVINNTLNRLAMYPDNPEVMDLLVGGIMYNFQSQFHEKYATNAQEVIANGELIKKQIGDYQVKDLHKTVAAAIDALLGKADDFCSETPSKSANVGTSKTKKATTCNSILSTALKQADLLAADASEIWYVVENEPKNSGTLHCSGHNNDTGKNFTYSYPGKLLDTYLLKDVHTGKVLGKKTFQGTAPTCVFTRCTLDTLSNTADCTGGEGSSTFDETVLIQWLKGLVK
jgi:hypothetical protein